MRLLLLIAFTVCVAHYGFIRGAVHFIFRDSSKIPLPYAKMPLHIVACVIGMQLASCSKQPASEIGGDDPADSFRRIVEQLQQPSAMTQRHCSDFQYDVNNTSSLVDPVVGTLIFKVGDHPDMVAEIHRYKFSWHDNKWSYEDGTWSLWTLSTGDSDPQPVFDSERNAVMQVLDSQGTTKQVDQTQAEDSDSHPDFYAPSNAETPPPAKGSTIVIKEQTNLYFRDQFYRVAQPGEEFQVYEYRPIEKKLYILSKDANGNPIGLNIPDR